MIRNATEVNYADSRWDKISNKKFHPRDVEPSNYLNHTISSNQQNSKLNYSVVLELVMHFMPLVELRQMQKTMAPIMASISL
jgi:hypothetical protein